MPSTPPLAGEGSDLAAGADLKDGIKVNDNNNYDDAIADAIVVARSSVIP